MSNALQAYLPACILDFLKEASAEGLNLDPPLSDSFSTVVLFADVSGYTKLCEAISMSGVSKPDEQLAKALTTYFEQLLRTLTKQGADVLKFAGDALLCVWPKSASGDLGELCRRAAQAAIEVKDSLNDFALDSEACGGATLSVKIGIGVGPITLLHVGGVYRRLEYLAVGTPLQQAFSSEGLASPGDVIVSPQVWDLISEHFTSSRLEQGYAFLQTCEGKLRKASVKTARSNPYDLMTRYIPSAVVPFVELDEEIWASELRRVTVLFVNLDLGPHLISITEQREVDAVQEVISSVQSAVYRFQGSLNKFLVDDKGSTLIAVFGLPPLAHEDDAIRGVLASLAICTRLHEMGLYPSIGVTTGVAFAGLVGSSSRHEYTVLGDTVNLSARLMQRATKQGGGILVEKTTQYACRDRILFAKLGKIKVKGKKAQISIYQPYSQDLEPVYRGLRDGGSDRRAGFLDRDVHSAEPSPDAVESAKMLQLQLDGYAKQHFLSLQKSRGVQPLSARDSLIGDALSTQASGGADMPIKAARIALPTDEARLTMPCVNIGTVGELAEATFARLKSRKMLPKGAQAPEEFTFLFAGTNIRLQNDLPLTDLASLMAANNIAIAPVVDLTLLHNSSSQETVNHLVDIHTQLRDCVQRLIQDKEGGVVIIEGEQGYGKSRLLSATVCEAPPYLSLFCGVGNPFELDRPLSVWCDLISQLPLVRLADKMRADEHPMAPYLGLLTEYLTEADTRGMHLDPATPEIGEIGDDSRARETYACNVMIALMQFSCERQSAIVVIDDAVFLDPLSWTLSLRMSREVQGLLLVLSTRPMNYSNMAAFSTKIPPEYEVIVADERTLSISLKPLPDDIIYQMACECLGHNLVPPMLAALILEKSHGNPLVVTEFIYALREEGIIVDGVDTVELRADLQYYDYARLMAEVNVPVPLTLQALLGCRLDRLSHTQRMLLKVMAVAGPSARSDVVYESWPNSRKSPEDFEQAFAELEAMSVITRLPTKPKKELDSTSIQYKFVNGFMRDMILSRMLAEQHGRLKDIIDRVSRARLERLASDCAFKLTDRKIIKGYMNVSVYTAAEWEERLARANEAAASAKKKKKRRWSKNKDAPKPEPVHRESRLYCLLSAYGTLSGWIDEEAYWTAASSRFPSPSVVVQHPVLLVNLDSSTMGNRSSTSFSVRVNDPMHDGVAKSGEYVVEMRMPEGHEMDSQSSTVHITKWATKVREAVQEQLSPEKQHMLELLRKTRKWKQERLRVGLKKGSIQLDIRQPLALTEGEKRLLQGQFIRSVIEVENKRRLRGILNQQVRVRKSSSSLFASNWKRRWMTLTESCLFFRRTELPQFAALQRQDSDKALNTPTSKPARSNSRFARSDLAKKKTSHTDVVALNTGTLVCELGGYDKSANVYTLIIKCDLWLKRLEPNWISRPFTIGVDTLSEAKKWEAAINAVILEHKKAILATRTRAAKAALTGAGGGTSSAASTESAPGSAAVASLAASRGGSAPATQVDDDFVPQTRMQHSISITEGAIKPSEFYTSGGAAPSSHNSSSTFPLPSKAPGQRDSASAGPASPNGHDASKRPPFMRGSSNVAREIAMRPYRVDSDGLLDSVMSAMRELAMTEVDFAQDHMGFEDIQGVIEEEPDDFGDDDDDTAAASSSGTMSKIVRAKLREFAQRIKSQVKTSRVIHGGIDNKQPTTKSEGDFVQLVNSADLDGNSKAWLERTFTRETGIGPNGTRHGRTRSRSSLVVVGIGGNEVEVSTEPAEELEEDRRRSVSLDSGTSSGTGDRDPLEPLVPGDDGADEENDEDDAESGADADADADDAAASSEPDADGSPSSAESSPTSAQKKPKLERSNSLSTKPVESTTAAELVALAHVADSFQKTYRRLGKEEREQNAALVLRTVRDPSLPEDLEGFADWSWDVLSYTPEQLVASVVLMFREAGYLDLFQIDHTVFANFLGMVRANYLENPFHNFYHGVDVCQSIYCFLHQFGALSVLDSINGFALMVAGLCHDVGHPALNNAYHIAARTPLVLVYGDDSSVLEQHHCATTFRILATPETNILKNLTAGQYRTVQSGIVDCIMATDMTCHFLLVEEFNTVVERWMQSKSRMSPEDQKVAMRVVLHCADISNPCKSWKLSKAWSDYIGEEFFVQGDLERERGLPISPNCDRETTDQAKLGVNFIDFIVAPLYVALRQMLPRTERCCQNLRENRLNWERLVMQGIDENESFTQEEKDAERERWLRRSTSFKQILTPLLTQTRERGLFRRTSMAILTEYIGANSTHDLVAAEEQDNANNDS